MDRALNIVVNGIPRGVPAGCTVDQLLDTLAPRRGRIAVERNGEIVPKSRHRDTALADGDRVELVVAVGGG